MKLSPLMLACALGCLLSACGGDSGDSGDSGGSGDSGVSLEDKSPAEQATAIVEAICGQVVECGTYQIHCSSSGEDDFECSSTYVDVSYAECSEEMDEKIQGQVDCWNEQTDDTFLPLLEECINAVASQACVSAEEMDVYIAELNAGEEPESLRSEPEVCARVEEHPVAQSCRSNGDSSSEESEPTGESAGE